MPKDYCSILTQKLHVDGCGTAPPNIKYFLFVETPKPWPENEKSHENYPNYAYDLANGNCKIHLLAPGSFSKEGLTKILFFKRTEDDVSHYDRKEYQIPNSQVKELLEYLFSLETSRKSSKFDEYASESNNIRDLFICGHLAKDYCCGTFGDALFQFTKEYITNHQNEFANLRIWQTSHLKGHKFAPTTIDFPEGRFWAHLSQDIMINKLLPIENESSLEDLRLHIRGLAGTNNFGQLAEREFLIKYGSAWIKKKKSILVTQDPEDKNLATVRVIFEKDGKQETHDVKVSFLEETITVSEHACGATSVFKQAKVTF